MNKSFVRVLGSADWLPTPNNDGACFTIDDTILMDTGWASTFNLINIGIDPLQLNLLCFTHMHADHCLSLPQLLYYWRIKKRSMKDLTIIGPAQTVRAVFERAFAYVFHDSRDISLEVEALPTILQFHEGDTYETDAYSIQVCSSHHAVPGLCYRIQNKATGHDVGFSGDTYYREEYADFFRDCNVLIHEASSGAGPINPERNKRSLHSSAQEAARVALESNAGQLLLTHSTYSSRDESVKEAQSRLDIPVQWATPYNVYLY